MLKITADSEAAVDASVLRLEGQVAGEWVEELRRAYQSSRQQLDRPLTLDLTNVTFIDSAGITFFEEVWGEVTVINCSLFAAEQLKAVMARRQDGRR
jgi:anti-anti-sigma regulatory factor